MRRLSAVLCVAAIGLWCAGAGADVLHDYEDTAEGHIGLEWNHEGVFYHDVNNVSGHFPDGETFDVPEDFRRNLIIEDAGLFFDDFPAYGSPVNTLTFGMAYIEGPNLTIGPLASLWMDLDELGMEASLDLGYFENGVWGGIEYRLEALRNDTVVASDSFVISDLGGRDNPAIGTLSVSGAEFDQLHLYAWYDGMYSKPRGLVDDLRIVAIPEPATLVLLIAAGAMTARRR